MFERFTTEARAVVLAAQTVARQTGTTRIDARHILVALCESSGPARDAFVAVGSMPDELAGQVRAQLRSGGLDAEALAAVGIDLDAVRRQTDSVFGPDALDGAARPRRGHIPFDREGRKALELSLREAIRLQWRSIDGNMLLLGILRTGGDTERLLDLYGVDVGALRHVVESARVA